MEDLQEQVNQLKQQLKHQHLPDMHTDGLCLRIKKGCTFVDRPTLIFLSGILLFTLTFRRV